MLYIFLTIQTEKLFYKHNGTNELTQKNNFTLFWIFPSDRFVSICIINVSKWNSLSPMYGHTFDECIVKFTEQNLF